jgi:uncharacterized protein (DUF362 family)
MAKLSRREFLKSLVTGLGVTAADQFLAACGRKTLPPLPSSTSLPKPTTQPSPSPIVDHPPPETGIPTETRSSPDQTPTQPNPTSTPAGTPDLVVARGAEPEELVRRALAALGGMEQFVSKGSRVIIKPNICVAYHTYEYAATTNPWVVGALVKLCLEAGAASVQVMDFPFGGIAQEAYAISGIQEQVQAAGGEMAFMPGFRYIEVDIPGAQKLNQVQIYDDILNADVFINVPIAKTHELAKLTLGMKNLMGVIYGRQAIHQDMGQNLADLAGLIRPELTVIDAIRILTDHGPTGGNLDDVQKLDTIIASTDIVAADSYATTLFGMRPDEISYIQAGAATGLGRSDLSNLRIEEISAGG